MTYAVIAFDGYESLGLIVVVFGGLLIMLAADRVDDIASLLRIGVITDSS
jgi:hypothetical protein